ncbi:43kDa postsynaptic protein [Trema orientale]|uniref:RING-type E3 ubiquitin transferase n=1 Tax=Trema orientale TaxID=63057 RepID=A0A2P5EYX1_TREOI|nr:43kDa postsynaptic protein [Trema orientale]
MAMINSAFHGCEYSLVVDQHNESMPEHYKRDQQQGHYLIFRVDFVRSSSAIYVQKEYTSLLTSSKKEVRQDTRRWIYQLGQRGVTRGLRGLPRHVTNSLAQEIASSALELAARHDFAAARLLPLYLRMTVDDDALELEHAMRESESAAREIRSGTVVSVAKSSIEALEEVNLKTDCCMVCLDKLSSRSQKVLLRMPCSHLYHKNCIVRWLETNHVCPVCRYAMPTDPS